MGRGTRSDTTASAPVALRRPARDGIPPAWLNETLLGDELRAVVTEVFAAAAPAPHPQVGGDA